MTLPWEDPSDHTCRYNFDAWDGGLIQVGQYLRPLYECRWSGCPRFKFRSDVPNHRCTFRDWNVRAHLGPRVLITCDLPECENLIPYPRELPEDQERAPIASRVNLRHRHFVGRVRRAQEDSGALFDRLDGIAQRFHTLEAFCEEEGS